MANIPKTIIKGLRPLVFKVFRRSCPSRSLAALSSTKIRHRLSRSSPQVVPSSFAQSIRQFRSSVFTIESLHTQFAVMTAKHLIGLAAFALLLNIQVQGIFFNLEPAEVAEADSAPQQRDAVTCSSPDDCMLDECCLANGAKLSARTKRWFFEADAKTQLGLCQRLGTDGSPCIVPFDGIFPDPKRDVIVSGMTPCAPEFICVISQDVPTLASDGEIGSCEPTDPDVKRSDDQVLQLLNDKEEDEAPDNNNDDDAGEELAVSDDAPSENDNVDNDDENNDTADGDESVPEENEETEEREEKWQAEEEEKEEKEEEQPLENTMDDFPADRDEYGQ